MTRNRKVILLGKQGGTLSWYEHVRDAFCDMSEIDAHFFPLNHAGGTDRIVKGAIGVAGRDRREKFKAWQLARKLRHIGTPDLVLITDLIDLSLPLREVLATLAGTTPVVRWIGDRFDALDRNEQAVVSHYCFTDTALEAQARAQGFPSVSYLPLGYNPRVFGKGLPWSERRADLIFIGGRSTNRAALIGSLATPITLCGKRWYQRDFPHHRVTSAKLSIQQVAQYYARSRGVLNVINSDNVANGLNMRAFEATGAGCLLFNDPVADLPALFEAGEEVLVYHLPEELNELYAKSQREPKWAGRIAANGFRRSSQCHRYQDRLVALLRELGV